MRSTCNNIHLRKETSRHLFEMFKHMFSLGRFRRAGAIQSFDSVRQLEKSEIQKIFFQWTIILYSRCKWRYLAAPIVPLCKWNINEDYASLQVLLIVDRRCTEMTSCVRTDVKNWASRKWFAISRKEPGKKREGGISERMREALSLCKNWNLLHALTFCSCCLWWSFFRC